MSHDHIPWTACQGSVHPDTSQAHHTTRRREGVSGPGAGLGRQAAALRQMHRCRHNFKLQEQTTQPNTRHARQQELCRGTPACSMTRSHADTCSDRSLPQTIHSCRRAPRCLCPAAPRPGAGQSSRPGRPVFPGSRVPGPPRGRGRQHTRPCVYLSGSFPGRHAEALRHPLPPGWPRPGLGGGAVGLGDGGPPHPTGRPRDGLAAAVPRQGTAAHPTPSACAGLRRAAVHRDARPGEKKQCCAAPAGRWTRAPSPQPLHPR